MASAGMQESGGSEASDGSRGSATLAASAVIVGVIALIVAVVSVAAQVDGNDLGVAEEQTVEVELGEMYVEPAAIDVAAGTKLTLVVTNAGTTAHDLKLDGESGTAMLDPGQSETVTIGPIEASTSAWCTVPGHREAGMEMAINVIGSSGGGATAAAPTETGAQIDFAAEPDADWIAKDPTAPAPLEGTVHEVTFETREEVIEIAPGVTQELWTFNIPGEEPAVPGPTLRGEVGDTFRVTLVNKGEVAHSIDFHASKVAWNDEMRSIEPGESLVYEYTATATGIFMYHCGTAPTLHHIGNGMYGAVIIDPPDLAPVDHEFLFVQSEFYTGDEGQPGDMTKMVNDDWDAVVFNGYVNQYKYSPIRVEPNERIRAWVIDDGPSENSSFHIVGTIFDTTYKEGTYLLRPDASQGGAQALDLQPAQGGFVEFTFAEAGLYPIVTHKFSNVGKGALGLFQAGEVETAGASE